MLLTGAAGVGKTSLICRAYSKVKKFIRLDLSILPNISLIFSFIARALVNMALDFKCPGAKNLKNEYDKIIHITEGRQIKAGGGPLPASVESIYSKMYIPFIPQDHVHTIIARAIKLLHENFGRILLLLDEANPNLLPGATRGNMLGIIRFLKMQKPSLLLWPVRDDRFKKLWEDPNSMERQLFLWHTDIPPLGVPGSPGASDILYKRLEKADSKKGAKIIPEDLTKKVVLLADGNIREYIRFCREILKTGVKNVVPLPIPSDFAISTILSYHKELIPSKEECDILKYLDRSPSSSSDPEIQTAFDLKETQIRERLKTIEQKHLAIVNMEKFGKLTYRPSEKALILLKFC